VDRDGRNSTMVFDIRTDLHTSSVPYCRYQLLKCVTIHLYFIMTFRMSWLRVSSPGYLSRYSDSLRAGRSGDRILVGTRSPHQFRQALGPTLLLGQWEPGLFPGSKVADERRWPPTPI